MRFSKDPFEAGLGGGKSSQYDFDGYRPGAGRLAKVAGWVAVVCVLAGGALAVWKFRQRPATVRLPDIARRIIAVRTAARYDQALQLVDLGLKTNSPSPAVRDLSDAFRQDLKPDIRFQYLTRGIYPLKSPAAGSALQLAPDDEFYYTVNLRDVARPCYLYMFLVDSEGSWKVLAPNQSFTPNGNPLLKAEYQVPDILRPKLHPAETPGSEKLFLVAAYWRIDVLEDLASRLAKERDPEKNRAIGEQVLQRIRLEEAAADAIPGLAFGTSEFHDSGRTSRQEVDKR